MPLQKNDEGQFSGIMWHALYRMRAQPSRTIWDITAGKFFRKDPQCVRSSERVGAKIHARDETQHHGVGSAFCAIRGVRSTFCIPVDNLLKD